MPEPSLKIPLPKGWPASVESAVIDVIALAQFTMTYARGWAADSVNTRVRLKAELDQANQDNALLCGEIRIKDARMAQLDPHHRPHYLPTERLAILELKASRGWSLEQTAKAFLVTAATVVSWLQRVDEQGPNALLQLRTPVNRFPDFVRYVVQRLKALCPGMGQVKMAQTLARAGLHLGATTIRRILKEKPLPTPSENNDTVTGNQRVVTAKYCGHVWHVDLTTLPTSGFWTTWFPFALPQCWPFAWWIALAEDHFSRRVMGYALFRKEPTSIQVRAMLGRVIAAAGKAPRYLVCDKGPQFWCDGFKDWCHRKGIKPPRYGAVGKHGSIAVIERLILTVKGLLRCLPRVPLRSAAFRREVQLTIDWYNEHRPHTTLHGRTPNEVYLKRFPANRTPRFELRECWPLGSPCSSPWALVRGKPGAKVQFDVAFHAGRRHLPVVSVKRAA